ncbi:MAG: prepilin-type N-terminal cleavage/methylation domain-containing protein [Burkholderiaceae bacterium]|nr:MAG: prepilin-type N-terminal cleavage/methylation domain-containing protein [Burkholderiaceae bacterium]
MEVQACHGRRGRGKAGGFTLIEAMIVVAIVAILAAVALPSYQRYVTRAKLPEAFSLLSGMGLSAQQYFQDNRTYAGTGGVNGCPPGVGLVNGSSKHFSFTCSNVTATTITMTATGTATDLNGIVFTLNQGHQRATTSVPTGWRGNGGACWVRSQSGDCS